MRKGRFASLSGPGLDEGKLLSLSGVLFFDFLTPLGTFEERIAAERMRTVGRAAPFLLLAHLVCATALALSATPLSPGLLVLGLGLLLVTDATNLWIVRTMRRPHVLARMAGAHGVVSGLIWASFAALLGPGAPELAIVAIGIALTAGIVARWSFPALSLLSGAAAASAAFVLCQEPVSAGLVLIVLLGLSVLSLMRAREALAAWHRRVVADDQASRASRFVTEFERGGTGWFWETDADGALTYVSAQVPIALGQAADDVLGRNLSSLLGGDELTFHLSARFPFSDVIVSPADRDDLVWSVSGHPSFDEVGRFLGFRGLGANLSDQRRREIQSREEAKQDSLTGLPNRAGMSATLTEALANSASRRQGCALFMIDLDKFKQVNDTLGHPIGDLLLQEVGGRLSAVMNGVGQIGRLGGDEFQAVIPGTSEEGTLAALAERLIQTVTKPYRIKGNTIVIGSSVGIAIGRPGKTLPDTLVKEADLALYAAKGAGRGTYRFYDPTMQAESIERRILEGDLRDAVAKGQLRLIYQPVVAAAGEELTGFEAFVRWHHPVRGILSPEDFLPLAEANGLMVGMGEWILRTATAEAATWPNELRLTVNISAAELNSPALPGLLAGVLGSTGLDPDRLELELREDALRGEGVALSDRLQQLKALGVRLSLDDFGGAQSTLATLRSAPLDAVKLDPALLQSAVPEDSRCRAVIASIMSLADTLDMTVTAEGVERLEELELVRTVGCHQVQGYLLGRPMGAEDARALAAESKPVGVGEPATNRPPRHSLIRNAELSYGGRTLAVRLRNISAGGAMIECDNPPEPSTNVQLKLDDRLVIAGEVRWRQEGRMGLSFPASFDLKRLGRAKRSAPSMLRPEYLKTEEEPDSPWAARTERLTIKDVRKR